MTTPTQDITRATAIPDLDFGSPEDNNIGFDGGGSRPVCEWEREYCPATPTHYVVTGPEDAPDTQLYCPRHYALTLAHLVEVHLMDCDEPVASHARRFGSLA